jgi:hypothetical protein
MKKLLILFVVLAVLLGVVYFVLASYSGSIVKAAVLRFGPPITQTTIEIHDVQLSPFNGSGSVHGLVVGNPKGFNTPFAFKVDDMHLEVKPRSLLSDTIDIDLIHVKGPHFVYETTITNSNLNQLLRNIQATAKKDQPLQPTAPGDPDKPAKAPAEPKKVILRSFIIEDATVSVSIAGRSVEVPLGRIELKDIGVAQGGITPDELAAEVMGVVIGNVVRAATEAIAKGGGLQEAGQGVVDGIRNLFN